MKLLRAVLLLLFVSVLFDVRTETAAELRRVTVDDLMKIEDVTADTWTVRGTLSPDGRTLAYVVSRSLLDRGVGRLSTILNSDVWLYSFDTGKTVNLTSGARDQTSFINPVWSPDGRHLAMMGSRGTPAGYKVWLWNRESRKLHILDSHRVSFAARRTSLYWLSNNDLIYLALPAGQHASADEDELVRDSRKDFEDMRRGDVATTSVLESLPNAEDSTAPGMSSLGNVLRRLSTPARCDISTRRCQQLSDALVRSPTLSPDRRQLAFLALNPSGPKTVARLMVINKDGEQPLPPNPYSHSVSWVSPLQWSPGSDKLGFVWSFDKGTREGLAIVDRGRNAVIPVDLGDLRPPRVKTRAAAEARPSFRFVWTDAARLAFLAARNHEVSIDSHGRQASTDPAARLDWWFIDPHQPPPYVAHAGHALQTPVAAQARFLGVEAGGLWRYDNLKNTSERIASGLEGAVIDLISDDRTNDSGALAAVVRSGTGNGSRKLLIVSAMTGSTQEIPWPTADAQILSAWPSHGVAVFTKNDDRTGSQLWVSRAGEPNRAAQLVHQTNTFVGELATGRARSFSYVNLDGRSLTGWVLLPVGYREGVKYPLVTKVHAGRVMSGETPPREFGLLNSSELPQHPQILAGMDYAVMFPSMPLAPIGVAADPLLEHAKNVMPAVDKLIEMGIADPERLAVMGTSFGGYTVYGLITQVNRFKAAIATAGYTDLVTSWGAFSARDRDSETPHEDNYHSNLMEVGQGRMMNPPWKDLQRYLRNSPMTYVDRVDTPLLMLHGDRDSTSLANIEPFFAALYRQHKRARFVRYFGEGAHGYSESPANNRDMTARIITWLDEHLDISRDAAGRLLLTGNMPRSRETASSPQSP
jgi:dipeptidyl aminopeptidase/acylaminoacyl peptidase